MKSTSPRHSTWPKLGVETGVIAVLVLLLAALVTHFRANRRERAAAADFPPEGQFLDVQGTRMHAVVAGSGPDVVLIHGSSGSVRDFTFSLMPALAKHYRVIAIDRPGMGWSDLHQGGETLAIQARLLQATAEALGASKPIVVGQSYGGAVALAWALDFPQNIAALVTISAPSHPWTTGLGAYYTVLSHPLGQAVAVPLLTAFAPDQKVNAEVEAVFRPQPAPTGYARHFAPALSLRRRSMRANARMRRGLHSEIAEMVPRYNEISVPVEIIHGTEDVTVLAGIHSAKLADDIEGANMTLLPGIGHMPHHVAMPDVIAAIDRAAERAALRGAGK